MRILIVEDDEFVSRALTTILTSQNYAVETAPDGQTGLELIDAYDYDLVMLDVGLPKLDGISLCRQARSLHHSMPILLLTAHDSAHEKAIGLDAGADDYVVKPFEEEELIARVRALLRRSGAIALPILEWGDLRLDPASCEVTYAGKLLTLTPKEYALLELFLRNNRRVFSCGAILEHLWSYEETPGEEAVRTHIKGLRQKLKAAGAPADLVETVYGIGYRLKSTEPDSPKTAPSVDFQAKSSNSLHPPTAKPSQSGLPAPRPPSAPKQTLLAIAGVWNRFKDRVSDQVGIVERAIDALVNQSLDPELRQQAGQEAHTLAGSLGTFGFPKGSQLARQIETHLRHQKTIPASEVEQLQQWVKDLRHEIEQPPGQTLIKENSSNSSEDRPLLLIVDRNSTEAQPILQEASNWGLRAIVATTPADARSMLYQQHPDVVLLDLAVSPHLKDGLSLLTELGDRTPPVPVIVFSAQDDLTNRLAVVRQGGHAFLHKSTSPAQVLETITQVLQRIDTIEGSRTAQKATRVLVVDDDPHLLSVLRSLLEPWGLRVATLADPRGLWKKLDTFSPDLLILDVEMPHLSGIELCQIVRNDPRWSGLPILFLTAHTDAVTVNKVFTAGGDDFVSKPVVGPELVTRIMNRLERIRLLRNMAEIDPLTRVANRQKSTTDLNDLLEMADQQQQPFCLAVLELDALKQINRNYGHAAGDAVLRQIANLLRQSFQREDVIARWGGEEFVIGIYGMTRSEATAQLMTLLDKLHQQSISPIPHVQASLAATSPLRQITFSAGVAQYPEDGQELQSLYHAADTVLQQAKEKGGDRVLTVDATTVEVRSGTS